MTAFATMDRRIHKNSRLIIVGGQFRIEPTDYEGVILGTVI